MNSILEYKNLSVTYPGGVEALKNVNFKINKGEFIVIVGLSGAGKSTLLRATNRLVNPTGGKVLFNNKNVTEANKKELRNIRSDIGMIFQSFNLSKRSSVFRNVMAGRASHLPTWRNILGIYPEEDKDIIFNSLDRVNILEKAFARADELSGGQQQRVGIARALAQEPQLMLADEPVASLDPPTSHMVMKDLQNINRELGITVIVNLHFIDLAKEYGERIIGLNKGEVVYDGPAASADRATFEMIYGRSLTAEEEIGRDSSGI
ncbi:MAG: phosphonate ABC transporter ATP-binding protein [Halanaerobiales bacterium]|nr:phosphonate ABC transporter ATP-binding protein [Halanaerobiales bacterium]